jgi:N-acetylmuramoyl-L-alanine amidase
MPIQHTVRSGDCISSIAYEHGLFWKTVWEHPDNAELKEKRGTGFQLQPGDVVVVPDKRLLEVSKPPEKKHKFKFKGVPAVLIVAVMQHPTAEEKEEDPSGTEPDDDAASSTLEDTPEEATAEEPAKNVEYRLEIGVRVETGKTDGEGKVKVFIMPDDREGRLVIEPGTQRERFIDLMLGGLDPIGSPSGIAQRLSNLGFAPERIDDTVTPAQLSGALAAFQQANGLEPDGQASEETLKKLQEVHGS